MTEYKPTLWFWNDPLSSNLYFRRSFQCFCFYNLPAQTSFQIVTLWQSNPRLPSFQCRPLQQHRSIQSWILSTLTSCQTTPKVAIVLLNIKNVTLCWAVRKTDKVFWSSKEDLPKSYPRSRNSERSDKWHRPPYLSCLPQCNATVHSNQIGVGHRKSHIDSIGMTLMGRISARNVKTAQILSWCSCTAFQ